MSSPSARRHAALALLLACLPLGAAAERPALPADVAAAPVEVDASAPAADGELVLLSRRLSERLAPLLRQSCLANAKTSVTVKDLSTGVALYSRRQDEPLAPASNMKLVTAAALQALLGPEHELRTSVRADRKPGPDGSVGRLYLVGGGDPSLDVEGLYAAAREVAAAGVRRVETVVADDSYFEGPGRVPSWPARNHDEWYSAPSSALSANFNVVSVNARGTASGAAQVWVDPFPSFFEIEGRVSTGRGPWSVSSCLKSEGGSLTDCCAQQTITVSGRVPAAQTCRELRAVEDPALFAAHGFTESLRRVGVEVDGAPSRGRAAEDAVLLVSRPSKPLSLLVHDMNKVSSNVFAETLVRALGAEILGAPGTREKGLAVIEQYLSSVSPRTAGIHLEDGSGLSPENRLTTGVLCDLLLALARDPYTYPEFLVSLPVGGIDGTLARRLDGTKAQRLVRAKTGRINGVVALSGYARIADGRDAVFSILVNDSPCAQWQAQDAVDALVVALVAEATPAPDLRARIDTQALRDRLAKETADVSNSPVAPVEHGPGQ